MNSKEPNALIHETSPYLLQHAYNPVQWEGWHDTTLDHAQRSGKLILISIGYAACHWCHVMEHECFEDPEVADVMNAHFIPIKVDREERPDVDQIYMDALQIMSGNGGWPLNIVALPDGRPFWGATYVPKKDWIGVLMQLAKLYREDPGKIIEYASDLTSALSRINSVTENPSEDQAASIEKLEVWVNSWKKGFDLNYGGKLGSPKFMTPALYEFLMHWETHKKDQEVEQHVRTTLEGMAYGGIYDQIGGGFSRYSVDPRWHIPHFEKMLYDNAQLLSLYASGYARFGDPEFKEIVRQTVRFMVRELGHPEGGFYASLDADSLDEAGDLEEGAFYTWSEQELRDICKEDFSWVKEYYNINDFGHWEKGRYVLVRKTSELEFAGKRDWEPEEMHQKLSRVKESLMAYRELRPRPRLDDKLITSWNGLALSGLCDAYRYCGLDDALERAQKLAAFIENNLTTPDGGLLHSFKAGGVPVNGYLEDFAAVIQGYIKLYSVSRDGYWMDRAKILSEYALKFYSDPEKPLLYFSSSKDRALIRRTVEVNDSVIPSSNSVMAKNLMLLGAFFSETVYMERASSMLESMAGAMDRYPGQYSNWIHLALWLKAPFFEVVITGPEAFDRLELLQSHYLPNTFLAASENKSPYPLFRQREHQTETRFFLCRRGSCMQPLTSLEAVRSELQKG
ncbi:thioredoxin domain-containing protein [Robiginitalea aurantiaca]|uniref:Thioredoxin domain-containing protein n=1 Tax=Robiginitalea aurantiaca TaxID=3056915 RepID=A0ABT7WC09_9FLAO|nr:thioredoxin domain-containing protein [Robiginitalea aurantiaca]MDM9630450.1 thioredoxin domain-containing protein [Robiginitalea aurantiaca]